MSELTSAIGWSNLRSGKALAIGLVVSLAAASTLLSVPAYASSFSVFYSGNTIGTAVPASETRTPDEPFALPPAASVTGSRTGYSFGGWSLSAGAAAVANPYTFSADVSGDTARLDLFAVWNTTISYDPNGADSGSLAGGKTSDNYRFGQNLTLPTSGTLAKSGFAFGGWMAATLSANRITSYLAAADAPGNPKLYAAWIKTVSFNANGASLGEVPLSQVFVFGGERLVLPKFSEMTLRRPGYDFLGWSASPSGRLVSNPDSYVPMVANRTLYAIWRIQTSSSSGRVFFATDKSGLRASERATLTELFSGLGEKLNLKLTLTATRNKGTGKKLSRARNAAVVKFLESFGLEIETSWRNRLGSSTNRNSKKNNRVTLQLSWTNPS